MKFPEIDPTLVDSAANAAAKEAQLEPFHAVPASLEETAPRDHDSVVDLILMLEEKHPPLFKKIRENWGKIHLHDFLFKIILSPTFGGEDIDASHMAAIMKIQTYHADKFGFRGHVDDPRVFE